MTVNELDLKLDELARQFARRERAQRLIGAGATSVAMTFGLGVILYLLEGHPVPLAIPFALYLTLLGATWFRYRRKTAMISRQRIALFLDERHPELENLFVTGATAETQRGRLPAWVLDRILEAARAEAKRASVPELFSSRDDTRLTRHGLAVAILGVALCLAAVYLAVLGRWDLDRLHSALILGLVPDPIPFTVEPGDARLRVGDDQVVWLRTADTESTKSVTWREAGGSWRDDVFLPSRSADVFYFPMNNVQADIDYVVRVGPGASDTYRLSVYNPPFVVSVELTCLYPAYLDLAPKALAYDRRQSVPEGSDLQVTLRVNKPLASAALVFASGSDPLPLARLADTRWTGRWTVAATDSFRIDLADVDGEHNEDWWHVVTTISDQPPTVRIREPRGDGEATRIEEVPFSFAVKDDYGLKDFGLQYEVSGRDPVRVSLKGGGQQPSRASVEYILTLEDLDLEPGDYLVWSVWAEDARPDRERFESLGDPYFLEIRPFARTFSEAVSNEGGFQQGEGGRGDDPAQQQKRIIIATWNLRRKSRSLSTEAFQTQRDRLVEAQQKLAAQSLSLTGPRELTRAFLEAASAAAALAEAAPDDPSPGLAAALTEEQRAYRLLLQLRPDTAQVARRRGEGSPRGGGDQQGLDALELSERRDFEERATTLGRQLADTEEIRDRIDDLARRQDAINRDIDDLVARVEDAGYRAADIDSERAGVSMGTTSSEPNQIESFNDLYPADASAEAGLDALQAYPCHLIPAHVASELGFAGPNLMIPTACAAGNYAIAYATDVLAAGQADFMLAGGADAFSRITYGGFGGLMAIAPDLCRPFDLKRRGMIPGEGSCVLVLESLEGARQRGARTYAEVVGYGLTCDAHHPTGGDPTGRGAVRAMQQALAASALRPDQVDYISAHGTGTGTKSNDLNETIAVKPSSGKAIPATACTSSLAAGYWLGLPMRTEARSSLGK